MKPLIPSIWDGLKPVRFPVAPLPNGELTACPLPAAAVLLVDPLTPCCIGTPCAFEIFVEPGVFAYGAPEGPG
jgi:hypothetical protein